jgi:hypothetical protein
MHARTLYRLVRPTARAVTWSPLAVGAALGLVTVLVPESLTARLTAAQLADLVRIAATCVALGAAFLLDDPASRSTPTVPTSRLARNLVRVFVAVPVMALWWAATLGLTRATAGNAAAAHLPAAGLSLEAATLVAAAVAVAAVAQRHTTDGNTGVIAAPAVLVLAAVMWFLPRRMALVVAPADPLWTAAHQRWATVLAAACVAFLWAGRRDPATGWSAWSRGNRGVGSDPRRSRKDAAGATR